VLQRAASLPTPRAASLVAVMSKLFFVYFMTNRPHGVLYCGVTSDLPGRAWQHRNHVVKGFTDRYNLQLLVWFEAYDCAEAAILCEKALKRWRRAWKDALIERMNPAWADLY
jgi:putative endonuclease